MLPVLTLNNLSYYQSGHSLFENINFSVKSGEIIHIRGCNGAGKTTLLKIISGMTTPSSGQVCWENIEISINERFKQDVCYLGHKLGLKSNLTVFENLKLIAALRHNCASNFHEILERLGLSTLSDRLVQKLSAGQKQKLALARLLIYRSKLWLLDEPFTALDVTINALLKSWLIDHLTGGGMIMITSHHALDLQDTNIRSLNLSES